MKVLREKLLKLIRRHTAAFIVIGSTLLTLTIILSIILVCDYAPFGHCSMAVADARIQYLDFFGYLKNVFAGQENLIFSLHKGLGGSCLALFAYYLASPLNVLIIFFQKIDLNTFFNLLVICKITLASLTFSVFLAYRFRSLLRGGSKHLAIKCIIAILLSCSYGLCQYTLSQASNIMWLDGVYMLPLLMLATYHIVNEKRSYPLAILCGLAILFNWYSAGINCLFILFWFVFELFIKWSFSRERLGTFLCHHTRSIAYFIVALALGVLVSSVLFIPTIAALLGTGHATLNLSAAISPHFIGEVPSIIEQYHIGAGSSYGVVSVFCGGLTLVGLCMLFCSRQTPKLTKAVFAVFLIFLLLTLYWNPFIMLFSLFEHVGSYWYRYSYIVVAGLLFLSAYYFLVYMRAIDGRKIIKTAILIAVIMIFVQYFRSNNDLNLVYRTVILLLIISICLVLYLAAKRRKVYLLSLAALFLTSSLETFYETYVFLRGYNEVNSSSYQDYISSTESLLEYIQQNDSGQYRISTTSNQYSEEAGILGATANYNESLMFGYSSLATYTSTPNELQLTLLNGLGYRSDFEIRTIVNTSIIGTDSLLGVKYILSKYPINGLIKLDDSLADSTGRQIYQNPYALPLSLVYPSNSRPVDSANSFERQNQFYSKLLNRDVAIYKPVTFSSSQDAEYVYNLNIPAGNYAVYGNIPATDNNPDLILDVNGDYSIAYARSADSAAATLVPSVFYVPTTGAKQNITVTLSSQQSQYNVGPAEFYLLDLDLLQEITTEILKSQPVHITFEQTSISAQVISRSDQALYLSLSADPEWNVYRNGVLIHPDNIGGLLSIPLVNGENHIEIKYQATPLWAGGILTSMGVIGITILAYLEIKNQNRYNAISGSQYN